MKHAHDIRYREIANFDIDTGNETLRFVDRLSRENGWTLEYAQRCIGEYKRFIYLASISETPVTPSDQVDQVWHLHLTYTRSYWHDLCTNTIGQAIHHGPTKGGSAEKIKYRQQYQQTLDRYHEVFGECAPSDIWPETDTRFRSVDKFVRLNRDEFIVVRKPPMSLIAGLSIPVFAAACVKSEAGTNIMIAAALVVTLLVIITVIRFFWRSDRSGGSGCGGAGGSFGGDKGHNDSGGDGGCGGGCGGCGG